MRAQVLSERTDAGLSDGLPKQQFHKLVSESEQTSVTSGKASDQLIQSLWLSLISD